MDNVHVFKIVQCDQIMSSKWEVRRTILISKLKQQVSMHAMWHVASTCEMLYQSARHPIFHQSEIRSNIRITVPISWLFIFVKTYGSRHVTSRPRHKIVEIFQSQAKILR